MKKLFFILIPSLIVGLIVFLLFKLVINVRSEKGALQVTSVPESKIYLNGIYLGQTPLCKCEATDMLKTGEYTIRLVPSENDLPEFQEKITITKSVLTVVDRHFDKGGASEGSVISLEPLKDKKSVELLSVTIPQQAEVFLDGNTVGLSPIDVHDVTESDHSIKVEKDGYKDKIVRVKTAAGYRLTAKIYLGVTDVLAVPSPTPPPADESTPAATSSASAKQAKVVILPTGTGFLRVRESNSLGALEIGRVTPGETYPLLGESNEWYQIELTDGTKGWISAQYAEKQ